MGIITCSATSRARLQSLLFGPMSAHNINNPLARWLNHQNIRTMPLSPDALEAVLRDMYGSSPTVIGWWNWTAVSEFTPPTTLATIQAVLIKTDQATQDTWHSLGGGYQLLTWSMTRDQLLGNSNLSGSNRRFIPTDLRIAPTPLPIREDNLRELLPSMSTSLAHDMTSNSVYFYDPNANTGHSDIPWRRRNQGLTNRGIWEIYLPPAIWTKAYNAIARSMFPQMGYIKPWPESLTNTPCCLRCSTSDRSNRNPYYFNEDMFFRSPMSSGEASRWSCPRGDFALDDRDHELARCWGCDSQVRSGLTSRVRIQYPNQPAEPLTVDFCWCCSRRYLAFADVHLGEGRLRVNNTEGHWCDSCSEVYLQSVPPLLHTGYSVVRDDRSVSTMSLCYSCTAELSHCSACGDYVFTDSAYHDGDQTLCGICMDDRDDGEEDSYDDDDGSDRRPVPDYDHPHQQTPGDIPEPLEELEWCWSPHTLNFHPTPNYLIRKPELYIGLELEVAFPNDNCSYAGRRWCNNNLDRNLFWAKGDGSVYHGFEIVTHPFQPMWGLQEFAWEVFDQLVSSARAYTEHSSCGGHIHMCKEAWSSSALWKLLQFHRYQAEFCGIIGGRGTNSSFGSFYRSSSGPVNLSNKQILDTAKAKDWRLVGPHNPGGYGERYSAVNLNPEATIELRYPAGTIVPFKIRKNIQWAHALWSFCSRSSMKQFMPALESSTEFVIWVEEHKELYPQLIEYMTANSEAIGDAAPSYTKERN